MPSFRLIFRLDTIQRFFRLVRFTWVRGTVGDGRGYSAKFTVALSTSLFQPFTREATYDWMLTLLGIRLHYCRSYGGVFAP